MAKTIKTIEDLAPEPLNPRTIKKKAAQGLRRSLERFGDLSGITWNKKTGKLVAGHQRLNELRALGAKLDTSNGAPALVVGGYRFPIRVANYTKKEALAANVAANSQEISGDFIPDGLGNLLPDIKTELGEEDYGLLQIEQLAKSLKIDTENEIKEDAIPEPPKKPITKLGDIWVLGDHRLHCGECDKVELPERYELLVTDPPYGVDYSAKNKYLNQFDGGKRIERDIKNDTFSPDEMYKLWVRWFSAIRKYAKPGASYYVTGPGDNLLLLLLLLALRESDFALRQMLVWVKNNHVIGRRDFHGKHEPILFGWVKGASHRFYSKKDCFSIWEIDRPLQSKLHPTMKPVALFAKAMKHSSKIGDLILDPFLGSGTTLIAAEQLNRRCFGVELEPRYVDVCIERWENLTGGKAKKEKGKKAAKKTCVKKRHRKTSKKLG